ncbi:hypothetical protein Acr_23g0020590 [Actinidia rufa]|uniref:Uncharacterized protein n=1 Tax=Actinidia rufa TaxID=165716 RepID=A0A7J0GSU3_9ERIC|nr:hypothetical protein Acr_23g0020590 [Actinidia rufa]
MTPDISLLCHCVTPVSPISIATDQVTRKQIKTGCRVGDLYILESLHIPLSSSSASCTVVSSFYLNQKSLLSFYGILVAPVAKEDLIYLDPFPSAVPIEEYSSTLDIVDIPLPTTSPKVSDCPHSPTTSSLIPPAPLVYSRRRVAPLIHPPPALWLLHLTLGTLIDLPVGILPVLVIHR